ncbi:AhpC/TSA family protein [Chitinophaga polysaccharea]|uniref:TlpA disulfide reductase family protein n=1 Tax=Chitinophaga TaxID=79328 RepID=UPI0014551C1D|nr:MULTISPECIES: TlpA disulfide reductase family protein [Chitinophaga]NLR58556.1 AhpC/TSA family protein [Chitinophaga polysaccharea]NLU91084.1 AhpC/TSA family protein [Chitinophaga sp. Ak27]
MKKVIAALSGTLISLGCFAQTVQEITLQGTITGDLKGHNKMYLYSRTYHDSTTIENGKYTFHIPFKEPVFLILYPEYIKAERQMYTPFGILMDKPVTYTVTSDIAKGLNASTVKGSEAVELLQAYGKDKSAAWKFISEALKKEYGQPWLQESDPRYAAFEERQKALQQQYLVPLLQKLVKDHPDSYASVFSLGESKSIMTVDQQDRLYEGLSSRMKQTKEAKEFHAFAQGIKNSAVGKKVKDFTLPDEKDQSLAFSQFKGKYVLIDFWASWCGPCRKSFPHMREVFQQYKDQRFDIYSISIDKSKEDWLKAVAQEKNPWKQALDNINIAGSGFAITGVPTTYLISPDGVILMKEVGFNPDGTGAIEKKLAELFGGKKVTTAEVPKPASGNIAKAIPMATMQ